jgi:CheY-like chemotaxis protein
LTDSTGIDLIRALKIHNFTSMQNAKIILLQGSDNDRQTYLRSRILGVEHALIKPVSEQRLFGCIAQTTYTPEAFAPSATDHEMNKTMPALELDMGRQRILIAEDVEMNVILLSAILKKLLPNCEIVIAENGAKAIQKFFETKPDLILMDVHMPILDGAAAAKNIRDLTLGTDNPVPIVAVTAGIALDDRERCRDAGMDDFLGKPVSIDAVRAILAKYLNSPATSASHA